MARRKREEVLNPTKKHYILEMVKAVIVAVIISLVAILIFAFIIQAANIADNVIPIVNQIIKGVAILVSCLICLRLPKNGWLRGLAVGLVYIAVSFLIFSLMNRATFNFGLNLLNDVAIGAVSGLISGIIASLIRKRKQ